MADTATSDPNVVIEAAGKRAGVPWVRYRRHDPSTGVTDRWEVRGTCDQRGWCIIGAAEIERFAWNAPVGTSGAVADLEYGSRADIPVAPGFVEAMQLMAHSTAGAPTAGCALTIVKL